MTLAHAMAALAVILGLRSAWFGYAASKVEIALPWDQDPMGRPVEPEREQMAAQAAEIEMALKVGQYNRKAAMWAAAAAIAGGISALIA